MWAGAKYRGGGGELKTALRLSYKRLRLGGRQSFSSSTSVHTLVGGERTEGAIDASNCLKPAAGGG